MQILTGELAISALASIVPPPSTWKPNVAFGLPSPAGSNRPSPRNVASARGMSGVGLGVGAAEALGAGVGLGLGLGVASGVVRAIGDGLAPAFALVTLSITVLAMNPTTSNGTIAISTWPRPDGRTARWLSDPSSRTGAAPAGATTIWNGIVMGLPWSNRLRAFSLTRTVALPPAGTTTRAWSGRTVRRSSGSPPERSTGAGTLPALSISTRCVAARDRRPPVDVRGVIRALTSSSGWTWIRPSATYENRASSRERTRTANGYVPAAGVLPRGGWKVIRVSPLASGKSGRVAGPTVIQAANSPTGTNVNSSTIRPVLRILIVALTVLPGPTLRAGLTSSMVAGIRPSPPGGV